MRLTDRGNFAMAQVSSSEKQQAHELIERLAPSQVSAVVGLLQAMLDPVARAIANAPIDDEPVTEADRQAVVRSEAWFDKRGGKGIPMEEVMAEFGLTPEDLAEKDAPHH
jgi:hypothetical protein